MTDCAHSHTLEPTPAGDLMVDKKNVFKVQDSVTLLYKFNNNIRQLVGSELDDVAY